VGRGVDRETEMPVFDADAAFPGARPVRRSAGPRRGGTGRGVGVAVAALVLLTGGVVVGGMLEDPGPSPSPSLAVSARPPEACVPLGDSVPSFSLGVTGEQGAFPGEVGYTLRPGEVFGDRKWIVPDERPRQAVVSGSLLEIRTPSGACLRHLAAAFLDPLAYDPLTSVAKGLIDTDVEPPSPSLVLGRLPDGEWVVRVTAFFESDIRGSAADVVRESYFRMRVGPGPFPTLRPSPTAEPTPAVVPDVACGPEPVSVDDVELLAVTSAPDDADMAGAADGAEPPVVSIALGEPVEIQVSGDACATSWDIRVVNLENLATMDQDVQHNPAESPAYAAQNRWRLRVGVGDFALVADLRFGADVAVHREWRLAGLGFVMPGAFLVDGDGSRVAVLPGCGLSFTLANGYSASDSCGSIGYPDGLEVLHVAAWSPVVLDIPGWTITSWNGTCGRVIEGVEGQGFETVNGCYLGNYTVAPGASPPAPVRFLARPGEQSVLLGITASRDGNTFSVVMYGVVDGE
jgi:hypothetical protein